MNVRSLNFKVSFIVGILVLSAGVIAGIGAKNLSDLNQTLTHVTELTVPRIEKDHTLKELFLTQVINERNFVLNPPGPGREASRKFMQERHQQVLDLLKSREEIADETGLKALAEFEKAYSDWQELNKEVLGLYDSGKEDAGKALLISKGREIRVRGTEVVDQMVLRNSEGMQRDQSAAEAAYKEARVMLFGAVAIALLFGLACAVVVLRSLSKSINRVIESLTGNSTQVTDASQQISVSSEQLAEASSEQAASLEETVATLEELTSMIRINSDNAKEAARLSGETSQVASRGDKEIHALMDSMQEISKDSRKIEEIINVIDDIAFQTNLLALNAAVEAARAGEQGKGFAVVAEAVRNLAQRSASAAKDINDLIKGSVEKIERGARQAEQSGRVLGEIVASAQKVSNLNAEISSASEEQSNGVTQISKAMNQLDQVTQVNAATSEEAAAAAQELSAQAKNLDGVVDLLTFTIKGVRRNPGTRDDDPHPVVASQVIPFKAVDKKQAPKLRSKEAPSMDDWGKVGSTEGF